MFPLRDLCRIATAAALAAPHLPKPPAYGQACPPFRRPSARRGQSAPLLQTLGSQDMNLLQDSIDARSTLFIGRTVATNLRAHRVLVYEVMVAASVSGQARCEAQMAMDASGSSGRYWRAGTMERA